MKIDVSHYGSNRELTFANENTSTVIMLRSHCEKVEMIQNLLYAAYQLASSDQEFIDLTNEELGTDFKLRDEYYLEDFFESQPQLVSEESGPEPSLRMLLDKYYKPYFPDTYETISQDYIDKLLED